MYIYIYVYIERERYLDVYIYIYVMLHIYIYICIAKGLDKTIAEISGDREASRQLLIIIAIISCIINIITVMCYY